MMTNKGLIIFDCDGVLVDSEVISCNVDHEVLKNYSVDLSTQQVINSYAGLSYEGMISQIEKDFNVNIDTEAYKERCKYLVAQRFEKDLKAIDNISSVIESIDCARCVCSSSKLKRVKHSLDLTALIQFFNHNIFTSELVENGKPAPDLFLYAAGKFDVDPGNCLVIEDSQHGIQAAKLAKMYAVGLTAGGHCPENHEAILRSAGADRVTNNCDELKQIIHSFIDNRELC